MAEIDEWRQISCQERDDLFAQLDGEHGYGLSVLASSTDPERYVFTEWGVRSTEEPVLRDHRWPDGRHPCKHESPAPGGSDTSNEEAR